MRGKETIEDDGTQWKAKEKHKSMVMLVLQHEAAVQQKIFRMSVAVQRHKNAAGNRPPWIDVKQLSGLFS